MTFGSRSRFVSRWISLSTTGAAASASTFVVFALVTRNADRQVIGHFALALALAQAVVVLIDAGYGPLLVRDALTSGQIAGTLSWALRRRSHLVGAGAALTTCVLITAGWSPREGAAAAFLILVSAGYGFILLANQAAQQFTRISYLQLSNALLFVCVGLVVTTTAGRLSTFQAVAIPGVALAAVDTLGFWKSRRLLMARPYRPDHLGQDAVPLLGATVANGVTGSIDTLMIGLASPMMLAAYAANQRPAYGLASISTGLTFLALPALTGRPVVAHRKWASRCRLLALVAPFVGAAAAAVGAVALPSIYGSEHLVHPVLLGVIVCAYSIGLLTVVPSTSLVVLHRTAVLRTAALVQLVLTAVGMSIAIATHILVVAALTLVVGRSAVLLLQVRGVLRRGPSSQVVTADALAA